MRNSELQRLAQRIAGHIAAPLDISAIVARIESGEYNAELMLQHLLLWAAKNEMTGGNSEETTK